MLSALWSFLQHPAVAVEDTVADVEHRLEEDLERAIRGRLAAVQTRLEAVKSRVVEDLKRELRRVVLILALTMGCTVLALLGAIFGLMAAWTDLKGLVGSFGASLVLAIVFLFSGLVLSVVLRSVLRRSQPPPSVRKIAS